jgi:hypothetical protein
MMVVPGLDQQYMPYGEAYMAAAYADSVWIANENDDYDWGMVILDRHIGSVAGYFGVASLSDSTWNNLWIELYGYTGAVADSLRQVYSPGFEVCNDSTMVYHGAQTEDGLSGGGIMGISSYPERVASVNTGTDYNFLCSYSELSRSTRITSSRYSWIIANKDSSSVPSLVSSQYPWQFHEGYPRSRVSMVSPSSGNFDMYIRGTNGAIWWQRRESGSWLPSQTSWNALGGSVIGEIAATSRGANLVDLFVREYSGGLIESETAICTKARNGTSWWPSASTWSCFTDFATVESPTATSPRNFFPSKLAVFGVNASGQVVNKNWMENVGWGTTINLGGKTDQPVAVVSRTSDQVDAFIRDADTGQICTKGYNGTWWPSQTTWYCIAGSEIDGAPSAAASGAYALDVVGVHNGSVQRVYWRGSGWQGPMSIGGTNMTGTVSVVSRTSGQLDFFAREASGPYAYSRIRTKALNGTTWGPSQYGWWDLDGDGIDVAAVAPSSTRLDVVTRGMNDAAVRHRWWDAGGWQP